MVSVADSIEVSRNTSRVERYVNTGLFTIFSIYLLALCYYSYDFSSASIAHLFGEILGVLMITGLLLFKFWKKPYVGAAVIGILSVYIVTQHNSELILGIHAHELKHLLANGADESHLESALKSSPNNKILKLMHESIKTQMQSIAATNDVFNNIEPQDLKNTDNQSLDQYGPARLISDLKTAASNVHAASEKYAEILKEERSKLEGYVRSLSVPERFIGAFLQSVDKRQDASKKTIGNVLKAHDDVYHILANIAEILLKSGSRYKVQNGRVVFYDNVLLTEYNSAALSLQQSLKRLSDAQNDVRKFVERSQQNWNDSFK